MKKFSKVLLVVFMCFSCVFALFGCNHAGDIIGEIIKEVVNELTTTYSLNKGDTEISLVLLPQNLFIHTNSVNYGLGTQKEITSGTYSEDDSQIELNATLFVREFYNFGVLNNSESTVINLNMAYNKVGDALVQDDFYNNTSILVKENGTAPSANEVMRIITTDYVNGYNYHIAAEQNATLETVIANNAYSFTKEMGDGNLMTIELTADKITGLNTSAIGNDTFTITEQGKSFDLICKVYPSRTLKHINLSDIPLYVPVGTSVEEFASNNHLNYYDLDSNINVQLQPSMISNWDSSSQKNVIIGYTYQGITQIRSMHFYDSTDIKTQYFTIDCNNYFLKGTAFTGSISGITDNAGNSSADVALPDTEVFISGYNANTPGVQTITATYGGVTKSKTVYVFDSTNMIPKSISVQEYDLTVTGGVTDLSSNLLTITYLDDTTSTTPITTDMLINYNLATAYEGQFVYLKYTSGGYTFYSALRISIAE